MIEDTSSNGKFKRTGGLKQKKQLKQKLNLMRKENKELRMLIENLHFDMRQ